MHAQKKDQAQVSRRKGGGHLPTAQEKGLTRHQPFQHFILDFLASRTMRKYLPVLSHPGYGV
jgi:hypothetical protein